MNATYQLDGEKLGEWLRPLCAGCAVIASRRDGERYHLTRTDTWDLSQHVIPPHRPMEPLKSLLFAPREGVSSATRDQGVSPCVVVGVANCDLSALAIHDHVFLKTDPVDPFYAARRDKMFLVSMDCVTPLDVCFCTAVGQQPFPTSGFDINLSPVEGQWVVEVGSERGAARLREAATLLRPAEPGLLEARGRNRRAVAERVMELARAKGLTAGTNFQEAIRRTGEAPWWDEVAENCVECGACNLVCCTCHCFLLAHGMSDSRQPGCTRLWDSCLFKNFARVAGGANPRRHRAERLYNRFDKKFNFFPSVLHGTYACDGCGRCVQACAGKIDIREVLRRATG